MSRPVDPLLRSLNQIVVEAELLSTRAELLGESVLQRQIDRLLSQTENLIEKRATLVANEVLEKGMKIFAELNGIQTKIVKVEEEFGTWKGQSELAEYLGKTPQLPVEQPIPINSESFSNTNVYFSSAVIHEFEKDPLYGNAVIGLLLKGYVRPRGNSGIKTLTDTEVAGWHLLEAKHVGSTYGDFRALIAHRPGELRVFKIVSHNRANYGAVSFLEEYLKLRDLK